MTAEKVETVTFGAGCFWHVEEVFRVLDGVVSTTVGYMGGTTKNPTYEEVCSNKTGHVEVVQVEYNSSKVSYEKLLDVFWSNHDPTTLNRQGSDIGTQYRSVVFYHTPEHRELAQKSKEDLEKSGKYIESVVTEIIPAQKFYRAEEYHQKYLAKHGLSACPI